jgi:2-polyprenyl-3-methyl-5-hydroxy-6-metoxy-1,4-benzoquinol methylase
LADVYRSGGGLGWSEFGDAARKGQADANRPLFLHELGQSLLPQVPDLYARLSQGARVADVGCGGGWSSIGIARAYPETRADGFDLDAPSVELARRNAEAAGVADRVRFQAADAADAKERYDAVFAFECIHDMADPVGVLTAMREIAGDDGIVIVMDERVAERFTAPGDEIERIMYGYSLFCCLPDGMSHQPSAATGTVMRPSTLETYAREAGFAGIEILPLENDFFRFYRLVQ